MKQTVTIEIPAESEALVRSLLALQEEMQQLALSAPDGTVLDACETAILQKGREFNTKILAEAVARRVESAEKKGRRSASVDAVEPKKTVAKPLASS
jgi:hypothetical protein